MSKKHIPVKTGFRLLRMELIGTGLDITEDFKSGSEFEFEISLETRIHEDQKQLLVNNRIGVKQKNSPHTLGYVSARYWFEVLEFERVILKDKGILNIPEQLQLSMNSVALSSSRGLLFSAFRGTAIHEAILPVIDPSSFISNDIIK